MKRLLTLAKHGMEAEHKLESTACGRNERIIGEESNIYYLHKR